MARGLSLLMKYLYGFFKRAFVVVPHVYLNMGVYVHVYESVCSGVSLGESV